MLDFDYTLACMLGDYEDEDAAGHAPPGGPASQKQAPRRKPKKQDVDDEEDGATAAAAARPQKRVKVEPGTKAEAAVAKSKSKRNGVSSAESKERRAKQVREKKERKDKFATAVAADRAVMAKAIEAGEFKKTAVNFHVSGEPTRVLHFEPGDLSKRDYKQLMACHGYAYSEEAMDRGRLVDDDDDDTDGDGDGDGDEDDAEDSDYNDDGDGGEDGEAAAPTKTATTKRPERATRATTTTRATPQPTARRAGPTLLARAKRQAKADRDRQTSVRELIARLANTSADGLGAHLVSKQGGLHDYTGWWVFDVTCLDEF